jgi:MFS family permease
MIALVQTGPAFVIDAASFGVAAFALLLISGGRRHDDPAAQGDRPSVLSTIAGGVRAAWADPAVRSIVVLIAAFNFAFTGPISVGLAFLADNRFEGGSAAFGLLFSAFGGGAVLGAIASGSIGRPRHLGALLLAVAVGLGIGLALIGLAPSLPVALGIIAVMGVLIGFINVQAIAWLQSRVPADVRGRVMSLVTLGSVGLAPVSLAIAGALIDLGAVTLVFVAAGGIVIVAALAGLAWGIPTMMVWPDEETP